jgi:thiamine-phosphate pyrophosphorylase
MFDLSLYLVTDRSLSLGRDMEWIVMEAIKGGVTMVQLREKDCSTLEFIELAIRLKQSMKPFNVPLIINDRLDVVLAADADGLHIGQSDMPYKTARQLLGTKKIIGLSVENMKQVRDADTLDVDYIGISPVFNTATKTNTAQPFGLEGIQAVMALTRHPAVGIGGINVTNADAIMKAGAKGIAVVSAICSANQPYEAAVELKNRIKCSTNVY